MARGSKAKYTEKQKRQAEDIAEGYEERGMSEERAKAIGWATVNKEYGGGAKGGSGSKEPTNKEPARKGGRKGGRARARSSSRKS
jgi:hypothetical protein